MTGSRRDIFATTGLTRTLRIFSPREQSLVYSTDNVFKFVSFGDYKDSIGIATSMEYMPRFLGQTVKIYHNA